MTSEKLPKAFKKKWVDALLSGEYKQADCGLVSKTGRCCCLAVAAIESGFRREELRDDGWVMSEKFKGAIPENFRLNSAIQFAFSDLNDDGVPFDIIAGIINQWL